MNALAKAYQHGLGSGTDEHRGGGVTADSDRAAGDGVAWEVLWLGHAPIISKLGPLVKIWDLALAGL
jgi:hypothetical protein